MGSEMCIRDSVESVRLALVEDARMASESSVAPVRRRRRVRWGLLTLFSVQVLCGLFLLGHEVAHPAAWW